MKIKELREQAGMTQAELAKKVGAGAANTICQYENGQRKIAADRLPVFASALGCSIEELFFGKSKERTNQ